MPTQNARLLRLALSAIPLVLAAVLAWSGSPPRQASAEDGPKPGAKKQEREDHPGEGAEYRAFVVGGGLKLAPNAKPGMLADPPAQPGVVKDTPRKVPADAIPKAIARVRELRGQVPNPNPQNLQPAAHQLNLALNAAAGKPSRVAGVPVGPLPVAEVQLPNNGKAYLPVVRPLAAADTIDPAGWKWVGPGNIGGRTRAVAVHPTKPDVLWVGGIAGGVWKTTDAGTTWSPLYDFMANMAVSCLALDPNNPDVLYAGTGEGFYNGDSIRGAGVFVSKDGGGTWNQLESTKGDDYKYVNRIAVAKTGADKSVMLVATNTGVFRSEDNGAAFTKVVGVAAPRRVLDVKFDPKDASKAVGSSVGSPQSGDGRAFYSTDGGKTWKFAAGIPADGRSELAYAAADSSVVYAAVDQSGGAVYRSLDGGQSYSLRSSPGHLTRQGWYANCIWAGDPTDPNLVVVGGLDLHRSTNAGGSFTQISEWTNTPTSPHADHHVIVSAANYDGVNNKTVFFGNDGGVYRAADVTTATPTSGWKSLNQGLGITQFYGLGVNTTSGHITGGTQDNGSLFWKAGSSTESFTEIFGGDGGESAVDSVNDYYYGEYITLQLHRSKGGAKSVPINQTINDNALFIAPFVLDPTDPKKLYAGGTKLWRTADATADPPQFTPVSGPLANQAGISAIGVSATDPNAVWIGGSDGSLFRSADAGPSPGTWKAQTGLPQRLVSRVSVDPADKKTVYATFTGYEKDNLYKTTDDGATWAKVGEGKLPEVPFYDVTRHPADPKLLYLGTEVGVFVSADSGATWNPTNQGPTNAPVSRLVWNKKTLVVGTHGRGIFTIDLSGVGGGPVPVAAPVAKKPLPDVKVAPPSADPPE